MPFAVAMHIGTHSDQLSVASDDVTVANELERHPLLSVPSLATRASKDSRLETPDRGRTFRSLETVCDLIDSLQSKLKLEKVDRDT